MCRGLLSFSNQSINEPINQSINLSGLIGRFDLVHTILAESKPDPSRYLSMVRMHVAHFTVCDDFDQAINFLDHVPLKYAFEKNLFLWRSKEDSEDYFFVVVISISISIYYVLPRGPYSNISK